MDSPVPAVTTRRLETDEDLFAIATPAFDRLIELSTDPDESCRLVNELHKLVSQLYQLYENAALGAVKS
jgi:hypothetical protein